MSDLRYGSQPFDRAAGFYDRTRALPPEFLEPLATTLIQAGGLAPGAPVYEPGIGTGRIAVPLAAHGLRVYGLDLSRPMLGQLRRNSAGLVQPPRATEGDIVRVPFADLSFDAAVAVHVFHLVSDWHTALTEIRRVLRPGAAFFHGSQPTEADTFPERFYEQSIAISIAHGMPPLRPGATHEAIGAALQALGAQAETLEVARATAYRTPRFYLDEIAQRFHAFTWRIPAELFDPYLAELTAWVQTEYGSLDVPLEISWRFVWTVWRFE